MRKEQSGVITLQGRVTNVFYSNPTFSAGNFLSNDGEKLSFAGKLFAKVNEHLILRGSWTVHPKFGRQFKVDSVLLDMDLDESGLAAFLANHPDIKGIGPAKAQVIAQRFGKDFEKILNEEPERIAREAKVTMKTAQLLKEIWRKTGQVNSVMAWLASFGLTHRQVTTLVEKLGNNAQAVLKDNPYILCKEIRGFGFKRVDLIARKMGTPKESEGRIQAGIIHCLGEALDQGDCWVELEDLIDRANALLVMDSLNSREQIEKCVDALLEEKHLCCISSCGRFLIARPDIHTMEKFLADLFMKAASKDNPHSLPNKPAGIMERLNEGQRKAVKTALRSSISLISGGAGVGKTFSISTIVQIYQKNKCSVVMLAPTGKAAQRLEQVVGDSASTIHRYLGYDGKKFTKGQDNPIDADVLIVDEVSMVDVPLAWQLFQAVDFDRTAVILVGDHNQLPPIGPGNILRDLIETNIVPHVILDKVVRQAGVLKENSIAILNGEIRKTSDSDSSGRSSWYMLNRHVKPEDARDKLLHLFDGYLNEKLGFDLIKEVQVLTPTHIGNLGTRELNIEIQKLIQRKCHGVHVERPGFNRRPKILKHDKVIQTRNNYDIGVMNGTIGIVLDVGKGGSLLIDFEGMPVEIESGSPRMNDLQLSYVISIHKAQGSEFPCVITIMHKAHSFMHHRNLFYTAITRAQKTAIVIGDQWGIKNCAQKRVVDKRKTFLSFMPESF